MLQAVVLIAALLAACLSQSTCRVLLRLARARRPTRFDNVAMSLQNFRLLRFAICTRPGASYNGPAGESVTCDRPSGSSRLAAVAWPSAQNGFRAGRSFSHGVMVHPLATLNGLTAAPESTSAPKARFPDRVCFEVSVRALLGLPSCHRHQRSRRQDRWAEPLNAGSRFSTVLNASADVVPGPSTWITA